MRESFSPQEIRYLKLLRKQYRTIQEASAEVAHLRAVLRLPKGTEHFLSDLHGEHAAFLHILHNASGVIKRKINDLYGDILSSHERDMLPRSSTIRTRSWRCSKAGGCQRGVVSADDLPAAGSLPHVLSEIHPKTRARRDAARDGRADGGNAAQRQYAG
ncbi:MAG: fructose-bisphosphatase class III [Christensenellales bacterium]